VHWFNYPNSNQEHLYYRTSNKQIIKLNSDRNGKLNFQMSLNSEQNHIIELMKRTGDRPGTGSSAGHLGFELDGEPQESMEPIKGDVRHVLHLRRPPDLHPAAAAFAALLLLATEERLPQQLKQQGQERPPLLFLLL
jgi:hypothetical protein